MFAKLAAILIGLGMTSGALLVNRQHRIDVAVETARTGDRLRREEASLGLLQAEVAAEVRPDRIAVRLEHDLGAPLHPDAEPDEQIEPNWIAIPGRFDVEFTSGELERSPR
jgi:hypothetical protein